jgi:hypothetical protein
MGSIEEKRVFGERGGDTTVYLATGTGVVRVSAAADRIGSFGLEHRCVARDLAVVDGRLAVATDEDVLFGDERTGFGPALAVGGTDVPIAAGPDGEEVRIARYDAGDGDADAEWTDLGSLEGVRTIDGDLIAAAEGVYRAGSALQYVGLEDVRDVSTAGVPLAATGEALYRLGNGWMVEEEGSFELVAVDRTSTPGALERACALSGDRLFVHGTDGGDDGTWRERDVPAPPAAVAVDDALYLATEDGRLFVDAGDGWRSQALGIGGVRAMVVG